MSRAHLDKSPNEVASMFDQVAKAYDFTNDLLSLGQTRRWRKVVQSAIEPKAGEYILDLAAGTGSSSLPLALAGATVIPCDFSIGMLEVGKNVSEALRLSGDLLQEMLSSYLSRISHLTWSLFLLVCETFQMLIRRSKKCCVLQSLADG